MMSESKRRRGSAEPLMSDDDDVALSADELTGSPVRKGSRISYFRQKQRPAPLSGLRWVSS